MTANARDEKWSEWIEWSGGECPLPDGAMHEVEYRTGERCKDDLPETSYWGGDGDDCDIIAYRYKIKEPEGEMHPDLEWLARNVSEWPTEDEPDCGPYTHAFVSNGKAHFGYGLVDEDWHSEDQWLQARKDLGLENGGWTPEAIKAAAFSHPEEEEAWQAKEKELNIPKYSAYFKDVRHIDTIDVYRVVDLFGCEKHGHPISHAAKKLLLSGSRTGGKDVESDVREAIDALHRWLEMREEDKNAL